VAGAVAVEIMGVVVVQGQVGEWSRQSAVRGQAKSREIHLREQCGAEKGGREVPHSAGSVRNGALLRAPGKSE